VSQPGSPKLKTSIFHGDLERDQYLPRSHAYFFLQTAFDHNFSQGLDLQQMYGAGFGWTLVKQARQTLDLKGSMSYERQTFQASASNRNLIGSVFSQNYMRKLNAGATLLEAVSITPSWNTSKAYSWTANTSLNVPVHKRLGFQIAALDTFLNDPPPSFKKNSFQLTMGLNYSLK
jgi:putative salt-induced outer membrane protein YdiY